ncbi:MAG: helix-turn-helix domain-containing protein [Nitrososphaerales archaeon]
MRFNSHLLIIILLLITLSPKVYAQQLYSISSTEIIIFRDGVAHVIQNLDVNETLASISIPLLSPSVENLIVLDGNNMPLNYVIEKQNITINTLGASKVTLDYFTSTLTQKDGNIWTLKLITPYEVKITLPDQSNIIYLNNLPSSITTKDNKIILSVPSGFWEISYVFPLIIPSPPIMPSSPTSPLTTPPKTIEEAKPTQPFIKFPIEYVAIIIIILAFISGLLLVKRRGKSMGLRLEDKEVLQFIAERGGKVLEAELRQRFLLPKSSTWRLVRRLERMGYVRVNKVGIQNEVELLRKVW